MVIASAVDHGIGLEGDQRAHPQQRGQSDCYEGFVHSVRCAHMAVHLDSVSARGDSLARNDLLGAEALPLCCFNRFTYVRLKTLQLFHLQQLPIAMSLYLPTITSVNDAKSFDLGIRPYRRRIVPRENMLGDLTERSR